MDRRTFIAGTSAFLLAPVAAEAQSARTVIVGFLSSASQSFSKDLITSFREGLSEAGFLDGQNVNIEYRWADGHYDRLPGLVSDLINRGVAVIAAGGLAEGDVQRSLLVRITRATTINDFAWL